MKNKTEMEKIDLRPNVNGLSGRWQKASDQIDIRHVRKRDIYRAPTEPSFVCWAILWKESDGALKLSFTETTGDPAAWPPTYNFNGGEFAWYRKTLVSRDGGETWADCSQGLPADLGVVHLAVNPKTPRILYAGHLHRDTAPDAGLYRSIDGGQNWARLAPERLGALRSLSLCASVPEVLYAVASAPGAPGGYGTPSRLWRSDDRGETWKRLDQRLGSAVAVHPNDPEYVIYATFATDLNAQTPAIWRSRDGGASWQHVARDIPLAQIRRICFDASDPQRLFALNSFCVYEGRDAGAPTAPVVRELETRP